jgi:hypothetical protein
MTESKTGLALCVHMEFRRKAKVCDSRRENDVQIIVPKSKCKHGSQVPAPGGRHEMRADKLSVIEPL